MPDHRSRRQKLEAMASQTVSPHEATIARQKLDSLPPDTIGRPKARGHIYNDDEFDMAEMLRQFTQSWGRNWGRQDWGQWASGANLDPDPRPQAQRTFHDFHNDRDIGRLGNCVYCGLTFGAGYHTVEEGAT